MWMRAGEVGGDGGGLSRGSQSDLYLGEFIRAGLCFVGWKPWSARDECERPVWRTKDVGVAFYQLSGFSFLASWLTIPLCPHNLSSTLEITIGFSFCFLGILPLETMDVLKHFSLRFSDNILSYFHRSYSGSVVYENTTVPKIINTDMTGIYRVEQTKCCVSSHSCTTCTCNPWHSCLPNSDLGVPLPMGLEWGSGGYDDWHSPFLIDFLFI